MQAKRDWMRRMNKIKQKYELSSSDDDSDGLNENASMSSKNKE